MNIKYYNEIKKTNSWFWDRDKKYYLVAGTDMDNLLSCLLMLEHRPNWEIGFFYDYNDGIYKNLDVPEDVNINSDNVIFVDCSVPQDRIKCISNHMVKIKETDQVNKNDINLNILDNIHMSNSRYDYHNKYNLNTLILIYSLLGLKPKSIAESAILLLPDSAFLGYFANKNYKDYWVLKRYLLEVLELPELFDVLEQVGDLQRFRNGQDALNINTQVWVTDTEIITADDVDLEYLCETLGIDVDILDKLKGMYGLIEEHRSYRGSAYTEYDKSDMWSFAVISKDRVVYSKKVI